MSETTNVLICGVGGQGVLLASEVLSEAAQLAGYDVKKSEVHGMSQRGGSVVSNVRFGEEVASPLLCQGEADVLMAFERLEGIRWLDHLKPGVGIAVVNDVEIWPMSVSCGPAEYPTDIDERLKAATKRYWLFKATEIATELGEPRAGNVVLLGALSPALPLEEEHWMKALETRVKDKYVEVNKQAFAAGVAVCQA
jgi:indolepyruvate ferredoxin oxidoreductase beta subunit